MKNVGILALQGSVAEHRRMLEKLNCRVTEVKKPSDLNGIDGIILPGGESTTIGKLLNRCGLLAPLKREIENGLPTWGTCAGMILLAEKIEGEPSHLGTMHMTVERNAYGSQLDSFSTLERISEISEEPMELVFIRAPYVSGISKDAKSLLTLNGHIVAVKENNMLATSFHPELTNDVNVHRYFTEKMIS